MGATIPFAMLAIRNTVPHESQRSFSYLYLANVLGAVLGATVPPLLVEAYGFHGTLKIGSVLNVGLAALAVALALRAVPGGTTAVEATLKASPPSELPAGGKTLLVLLFGTGCTSLGVEVVWVRQFTPYLGTVVYAFASILGTYLISTFIGSQIYRRWSRHHAPPGPLIWAVLGCSTLFAALSASPQFHLSDLLRLSLGIAPFSGILGFVTPMLVDRWSRGDPERAGVAYAVNVVGCIVGPLLSGFLLLPWLGERWVLLVFALPWLVTGMVPGWLPRLGADGGKAVRMRIASCAVAALTFMVLFLSKGYEDKLAQHQVLRDHTATIIAAGSGMDKQLLVNGYGITSLTPITKMMAHLPLAFLSHTPQSALVVCFGMGTTYRSLLSWNIPTTAVELVPSVPRMFWYFHADAQELLQSPLSHVVIDDGRDYLERTGQAFDVITIDPPPPVEAAGSSLLYSKEFYATIKRRLRPGGILQQWLPNADEVIQAAVARALAESFPYVRVFGPVQGRGLHFLASNQPLPTRSAEGLAGRMPAAAARDLVEWGPQATPAANFVIVLSHELPISSVMARAPDAPALQDDRPTNEYYLLRRRVMPQMRRYQAWF